MFNNIFLHSTPRCLHRLCPDLFFFFTHNLNSKIYNISSSRKFKSVLHPSSHDISPLLLLNHSSLYIPRWEIVVIRCCSSTYIIVSFSFSLRSFLSSSAAAAAVSFSLSFPATVLLSFHFNASNNHKPNRQVSHHHHHHQQRAVIKRSLRVRVALSCLGLLVEIIMRGCSAVAATSIQLKHT